MERALPFEVQGIVSPTLPGDFFRTLWGFMERSVSPCLGNTILFWLVIAINPIDISCESV